MALYRLSRKSCESLIICNSLFLSMRHHFHEHSIVYLYVYTQIILSHENFIFSIYKLFTGIFGITITRLYFFFRTIDQHKRDSVLKADFHGCFLTVSKSCCPSYIGSTGIVIMETRNTFKIITKQNHIKCKLISVTENTSDEKYFQ